MSNDEHKPSQDLIDSLYSAFKDSEAVITKEAFSICMANFISVRNISIALAHLLVNSGLTASQQDKFADLNGAISELITGIDKGIGLLTDLEKEKALSQRLLEKFNG